MLFSLTAFKIKPFSAKVARPLGVDFFRVGFVAKATLMSYVCFISRIDNWLAMHTVCSSSVLSIQHSN